jgi:hypothetical protein
LNGDHGVELQKQKGADRAAPSMNEKGRIKLEFGARPTQTSSGRC